MGHTPAIMRRGCLIWKSADSGPMADFDALADEKLAQGLISEAQLDDLTDQIARGRSEADATEELRALRATSELPAAQTAAQNSEQMNADIGSMLKNMERLKKTFMQMASPGTPDRQPGSQDSKWEGHPARALFLAVHENRTSDLERLLSADASMVDALDSDGWSLLHLVALSPRHTDPAAVDVVARHGGSLELRTKQQESLGESDSAPLTCDLGASHSRCRRRRPR